MAPVSEQMARDFKRGFYDDIIRRVDEIGGDQSKPLDPRLLYWRGLTFYQLAWYPEAIADLTRAQAAGIESQDGGLGVGRIAR